MSTYSPVSSICLVAWAKRASSRSVGGIWKNPGRKASSAASTSTPTERACDAVAASTIAVKRKEPCCLWVAVVVIPLPQIGPDNREIAGRGIGRPGNTGMPNYPDKSAFFADSGFIGRIAAVEHPFQRRPFQRAVRPILALGVRRRHRRELGVRLGDDVLRRHRDFAVASQHQKLSLAGSLQAVDAVE